MGERTCVASVPENEPAVKFDPYPVLRESVSFGRYVSESLDWGKWSSFSQNRYLEEAEECSSRGAVAQMKAHFEDRYKKVAAAKKAAALLQQENTVAEIANQGCERDPSSTTVHEDSEFVEHDIIAAEQLKDADIVVNESSKMEHELSDSVDVLHVNLGEINPCKQTSPLQNQASEPLEGVENKEKDELQIDRNSPLHKSPLKEIFTYSNQDNLSSSDTKRKSTKLRSPYLKLTNKSIPFPSSPETTSAKCTNDNKSTIKIQQMFRSSSFKAERSHPMSKPPPNARSTFSCFKLPDVSNSHPTPTKQSPKNKSKHVQAVAPLRSEKRNITTLEDGKPESRNGHTSVSDFGKTSKNTYGKSSACASSQSASLFCFWSKERSERRKEYILKMEEKLNAQKLERAAKDKEKADNELKILRQRLGFKARPMPDFYRKKDTPTNEATKKVRNPIVC